MINGFMLPFLNTCHTPLLCVNMLTRQQLCMIVHGYLDGDKYNMLTRKRCVGV